MLYFQPNKKQQTQSSVLMEEPNSQTSTTGTKKRENDDEQHSDGHVNKKARINDKVDDDVDVNSSDAKPFVGLETHENAENEAMDEQQGVHSHADPPTPAQGPGDDEDDKDDDAAYALLQSEIMAEASRYDDESRTKLFASLLMRKLEAMIPIPRCELKSHVTLRVYPSMEGATGNMCTAKDGSIWMFRGRIIRGRNNHVTVWMKSVSALTDCPFSSFREEVDQSYIDRIRTVFDKLCDGEDSTDIVVWG
jgi:hypothetical protein